MSIAEPKLVLGPELAGTLMTPEEFDAVDEYDDLYRYELIHGVLVVSPIALPEETGPNEELGRWLLNYREQHPRGSALDYTLPEQIIRTRVHRRRADRLIWIGLGRMPNVRLDVPTIAVEFVSAAKRNRQRDYVEKRQEYMAIKIAEYWIIDRFQRTLTVYRSKPGQRRPLVVHEHEIYRTPLLPGFELPLGRLLKLADDLQSE